MIKGIKKAVRPFSVVLRAIALTLILCATGSAWAVMKPVAVWNRDFSNDTLTRNGRTLTLSGNGYDNGCIVIKSASDGASGGVVFAKSDDTLYDRTNSRFTAIIAYSDIGDNAKGGAFYAVNSSTGNAAVRSGVYMTSAYGFDGLNNNPSTTFGLDVTPSGSTYPTDGGLHFVAAYFSSDKVSNYEAYGGKGTWLYVKGASSNFKAGKAGLVYSNEDYKGLTFGGVKNDTTRQLTGAKIHYLAVFENVLETPEDTLNTWALTEMTSALTPASGDTLSSANNATLVHQGINLPTGGNITIDGDVTVAALFAQGNSEIRFADSNSSLTVNGVVYVAGSNTLTVDASEFDGLPEDAEESVTHDVLLCANIAGTIDITAPTIGGSYVVDTAVDATGCHVIIAKGANYDETITGSKSWSTEKPEDWVDGPSPTITITVEDDNTAAFTFDEAVQAGTVTIHCDGNLTLTMGANVTFSSLVIEGSGNVTLAKSGSPTISIGAYDFSACTGAVTLNYVIADPSTVSGAVVLGAAYSNETSIPAFMDGVTIGTAMGSVTAYKNVVPNVTIASGASLTVGGSMNTGSDGTKNGVIGVYKSTGAGNYIVEGNLTAGAWHVQEDNAIASIAVRNGGVADFTSQNAESMLGWSYGTYSYSASGTGSKLAFYTISSRYLSAAIPINISDSATLEIKNSISVKNGSVAGYNINLSNAKIASSGGWSTSTSGFSESNLKIKLSGANTFDTSSYNVTYSHQITDQNTGTPGSLTKTGSGKLTLTAASPAVGTFTVSAGELEFTTGSWAGNVTVSSGATLTVPGNAVTIAGNVTVGAGGILSVASEADIMNVCGGTLTIDSSATVKINGEPVSGCRVVGGNKLVTSSVPVWTATEGNISDSTNWSSGSVPSSEDVVIELSADTTIHVNSDVTLGKLYVLGSGTLTFDGSSTLTATGFEIASSITSLTVDIGTTVSFTTTGFDYANPVYINGTLKTAGDTVLSSTSNSVGSNGHLEVTAGTTSLYSGDRTLSGTITVRYGATLAAYSWDSINYYGTTALHVYGTLNLGTQKWSFEDNNSLYLYKGCAFTYSGNGRAMDLCGGTVYVKPNANSETGDVTIGVPFGLGGTTPLVVDDGMTLIIDGKVLETNFGTEQGFTKTGDGLFNYAPAAESAEFTGVTAVNGGKMLMTSLPTFSKVNIATGATFTLKNTAWTSAPTKFGGAGTLELYNDATSASGHLTHSVTGVDFGGTLRFTSLADPNSSFYKGHVIENTGFLSSSAANKPQIELNTPGDGWYNVVYLGPNFDANNASLDFRDLKGSGKIVPFYNGDARNHYLNMTQTEDSVFSGNIAGDETRKEHLSVTGTGAAETAKTLTISGSNGATGTLSLSDYAKVVFSESGSWANGIVTVGANGYLESTNAAAVTKLTLQDGANIVFPASTSTLSSISALTFASGTTKIHFGSGVTPTSGTKLINWSSAPAGSFVFDDGTTTKQFGGAYGDYYMLEADATGLYIRKAVAADRPDSTKLYASIARALEEQDTVYLISPPNETVTLNAGKTIINMFGVDVSNLTVNAPTYEYVSPLEADANGNYSLANEVNATPTYYYWKGASDSAWSTVGNWKYIDGEDVQQWATRCPTSVDTVIFNDGATVTLNDTVTVAGIEVNGDVSISATAKSLNTSGNVTTSSSGTLTLSDVCLASAAAGVTVAPAVNFTNDSEISGDYPLTINGNVTISGSFKARGGTGVERHTITGDVTINSGANFSSGGVWVFVNGDATVKGSFTSGNSKFKFCRRLTIEAGRVTANGSNVNVDSDAISVVLAGLSAEFEDTRAQKIDDSKVSTTVPHGAVKKTGNIYSVSRCGTIFSVY